MGTENKMTPEIARELRRVAHDLSNALETIVQATYLVSQSDLPESARRWVKMMDQASQEAVTLNRKLREILRSLS
jgi:truncated hemoglobin YjbI